MSRLFLGAALTMALVGGTAFADDTATSECLQQGDSIGAFYVTKVAGAEDDGVETGEALCYRCRYGASPMVMVFTRKTEGSVPKLAKALNEVVADNESERLRGFVTLLGDDADELGEQGVKLAKKAGAKNIPVVVAKDTKMGPSAYRIPADKDVTIVIAKESQVVSTHTFDANSIDIAAVMSEVKEMLN